jgi:hypothetical protein
MAASPYHVLDYLAAVESGHTAGPVTDNAYWLLKVNDEFIRDRVDLAGLHLDYVCGNRWRVSSPNYVPVHLTWEVVPSASYPRETGQVDVPARTSDAAPFAEAFFTTANAAPVRLFYRGQMIKTAGNEQKACQ